MRGEEAPASDRSDRTEGEEIARATYLPAVVVKVVQEAAARLASPACEEIFSDFRDARGNTLQQNLDALGVSGARYLTWALFYDGQGKLICEYPSVVAATTPGSRAIFICTAQFSFIAQRQPGLAAALVIHEELHSLGLGENPPASKTITAQVLARCGK